MRLGFTPLIAAAPAAGPAAPLLLAASFAPMIANWFSRIGAGRREADAIVPTQNELGDYLTAVDNVLKQALSIPDLQSVYAQLLDVWGEFLAFIFADEFTADGDTRASDGARETMEWQVEDRLRQIAERIVAMGGRVESPSTVMQGAGSAVPRLETYSPGSAYFPQAGALPPVNTLPPLLFQSGGAAPAPASGLMLAAAAALGGWLLFGGSGR